MEGHPVEGKRPRQECPDDWERTGELSIGVRVKHRPTGQEHWVPWLTWDSFVKGCPRAAHGMRLRLLARQRQRQRELRRV